MKTLNQLAGEGVQFVVIKIDETKYWKDEIKDKACKIEGVYLIDLTEPTHLCEISVSYPGTQLKNFIQNFEAFSEDELTELEREELEVCKYFHGNSEFNIEAEYGSEEIMDFEEVLEYEQCNPTIC